MIHPYAGLSAENKQNFNEIRPVKTRYIGMIERVQQQISLYGRWNSTLKRAIPRPPGPKLEGPPGEFFAQGLHILAQSLSSGMVKVSERLIKPLDVLGIAPRVTEENFAEAYECFVSALLEASQVPIEVILDNPVRAEFFMRIGAPGLAQFGGFREYEVDFDGVPDYLRPFYTRALWLEMRRLDLLPVKSPPMVEKFSLRETNGSFDQRAREIKGRLFSPEMDVLVGATLRAEFGHWLFQDFRLDLDDPVIEVMDRMNIMDYSVELEDQGMVEMYSRLAGLYFDLGKGLSGEALELIMARARQVGYQGFGPNVMRRAREIAGRHRLSDFSGMHLGRAVAYTAGKVNINDIVTSHGLVDVYGTIGILERSLDLIAPDDVRLFFGGTIHGDRVPEYALSHDLLPRGYLAAGIYENAERIEAAVRESVLLQIGKGLLSPGEVRLFYRDLGILAGFLGSMGAMPEELVESLPEVTPRETKAFLTSDLCPWVDRAKLSWRDRAARNYDLFQAGFLRLEDLISSVEDTEVMPARFTGGSFPEFRGISFNRIFNDYRKALSDPEAGRQKLAARIGSSRGLGGSEK